MWLKKSKRYFCKIENFGYGEINERSFSNPTPGRRDASVRCKTTGALGHKTTVIVEGLDVWEHTVFKVNSCAWPIHMQKKSHDNPLCIIGTVCKKLAARGPFYSHGLTPIMDT